MRSIVVLCLAASACVSKGPILSQIPIESETFDADYRLLASCSYERLDKTEGTGIKKTDLPTSKTIRLTLEGSGVRYWEAIFTREGPSRTRVDLTSVQTLWGTARVFYDDIMPAVRACALEYQKVRSS